MKKWFIGLGAVAAFALCGVENLLTNSSFEETVPLKKGRWQIELVKDWVLDLNSGVKKCDISLVQPGLIGKNALRLHTIGKEGFCSGSYSKNFPVTPGSEVVASVMMRGKGSGYIRVYYIGKEGKLMKNYHMFGNQATAEWKILKTKFIVPEGVEKVRYSLQTLRNDADVQFDDAVLNITAK